MRFRGRPGMRDNRRAQSLTGCKIASKCNLRRTLVSQRPHYCPQMPHSRDTSFSLAAISPQNAATEKPLVQVPLCFGTGLLLFWRRCAFGVETCSIRCCRSPFRGAGPHPFSTPAPRTPYTCAIGRSQSWWRGDTADFGFRRTRAAREGAVPAGMTVSV